MKIPVWTNRFSGRLQRRDALALMIPEKGVRCIFLWTDPPVAVKEITALAREIGSQVTLQEFTVKDVQKVSTADRVCIFTITDLKKVEGLLTGNYSNAFFLVHFESVVNTYVELRPFRVNAGAAHAYILMLAARLFR